MPMMAQPSTPLPAEAERSSSSAAAGRGPVVRLDRARLSLGHRTLWSDVSLDLRAGEFLAVLGSNGSGKTSLLRVILGLRPLSSGTVSVLGRSPRRGSPRIGYVPQQRRIDPLMPMRGRDLVAAGLDGHRWGIGWPGAQRRRRVEEALRAVDAEQFADVPVGLLSGGEQQRIRIAQALVADPDLLLCDEPLLSLDLASQRAVTALVDRRRRTHGTAVVFVTHEINPVLSYVDRVLYVGGGRAVLGPVDEVMNSTTLTDLYGTPVEVIRTGGRILVAGLPDEPDPPHHADTDETDAGGQK
jgi:zinc/manganese transport system ATP-binding protein